MLRFRIPSCSAKIAAPGRPIRVTAKASSARAAVNLMNDLQATGFKETQAHALVKGVAELYDSMEFKILDVSPHDR